MTKVAYVVLAHRSPQQLSALIRAVAPAEVFLHVDSRTPPSLAQALMGAEPSRVTLIRSRPTRWASWSIVEATLAGMQAAVDRGASHVAAMSGQCLPLMTHDDISTFLEQSGPVSYLRSHPVPSWNYGRDGGMNRFRGRHRPVRGHDVRVAVPNPLPPGLQLRLGSFQCVVDAKSVDSLLKAAASPVTRRFFSRVWIPDESFMHSVLATTRPDSVVSENLWFMDWNQEDRRHPRTFTAADVDQLEKVAGQPSDAAGFGRAKLFARKFDADMTGTDGLDVLGARLGVPYL